jgi:hypothetical protein
MTGVTMKTQMKSRAGQTPAGNTCGDVPTRD